jgi:hypothetical protein
MKMGRSPAHGTSYDARPCIERTVSYYDEDGQHLCTKKLVALPPVDVQCESPTFLQEFSSITDDPAPTATYRDDFRKDDAESQDKGSENRQDPKGCDTEEKREKSANGTGEK